MFIRREKWRKSGFSDGCLLSIVGPADRAIAGNKQGGLRNAGPADSQLHFIAAKIPCQSRQAVGIRSSLVYYLISTEFASLTMIAAQAVGTAPGGPSAGSFK
jgi:hypothetical protein